MSRRSAIVIVVAGVLAAACSPQAARPGSGVAASGASSPLATGASALAVCSSGDLRIRAVGGNGASQHASEILAFTNTSARPCEVRGYPEVALLRPNGTTLALAKQSTNGFFCRIGASCPAPTSVRLAPGQEAGALFEWMDANDQYGGAYTATACPDYGVVAIRFTAPGANASALTQASAPTVDPRIVICGDAVVHAVTPGLGADL